MRNCNVSRVCLGLGLDRFWFGLGFGTPRVRLERMTGYPYPPPQVRHVSHGLLKFGLESIGHIGVQGSNKGLDLLDIVLLVRATIGVRVKNSVGI